MYAIRSYYGTIQTKEATIRGVGIPKAGDIIQVDRYNEIGNAQVHTMEEGSTEPKGFQVDYIQNGSWVRFNDVDFGLGYLKDVSVRAATQASGGTVELRVGALDGQLLASIPVTSTQAWNNYQTFTANFTSTVTGVQDIFLVFKGSDPFLFNVNWIKFTENDVPTSFLENECSDDDLVIMPNPAEDIITLNKSVQDYKILNMTGETSYNFV